MWYMNEERELLAKAFREFAETEIRPFVPQMEKNEAYPREIIRKMGKLGMLGLCVDEEYGGCGADYINYGILLEEIAKESHTMALLTFTASQLTAGLLHKLCTPEQVEKYIKPALRGDILLSLANNESCGSGNIPEFETRAILDGDEWVINGCKTFITNVDVADVHVVTVITKDVDPATLSGASLIAIPADTPGCKVGHIEHKLGWKGSHTGTLYFDNCRVPKENLIGPINEGYNAEGMTLMNEITAYGPMDLGAMEAVWAKTKDYLKQRVQGGVSIWDAHQTVRNQMSELWILIENFRNTVFAVLGARNMGENVIPQAISIKVEGERLMQKVVSECIELHGGMGVIYETDIERYYRDGKMGSVGCGSNHCLINTLTNFI